MNISSLCLDKVTSEFPKYRMEEVEKDIQRALCKSTATPSLCKSTAPPPLCKSTAPM